MDLRSKNGLPARIAPRAECAPLSIVVSPRPCRKADAEQQYEARLEGELLCLSRTPFLAAARALLEKGHAPQTEIAMLHAGSDVVALRARLGDAARLTVREDEKGARLAAYRPPGAGASARTGFSGLGATNQPPKANACLSPHPGTVARKTVRSAA
jgi:hypothetical protein